MKKHSPPRQAGSRAGATVEDVIDQVEKRAAELFTSRRMWCAEAVLYTLNRTFSGPLDDDTARRLASGLGGGIGNQGCSCGGLTGAALAIGLFLGNAGDGWRSKKQVLAATARLHRLFVRRLGATCCHKLKSGPAGNGGRIDRCAANTATGAGLAARIVLEESPVFLQQVDWAFLKQRESRAAMLLRRAAGRLPI